MGNTPSSLAPGIAEDQLTWLTQGHNDAEFLGAAGGFMYGNVFDVS